ncbi:hypothetical protein [Spongiimicrobium sp. 3-5]|uniref:hypothetical protein n=1 Tax=Spongiimicrobium sp. 3-5 TaxID=3332596 RepID=UPI00397E97EF
MKINYNENTLVFKSDTDADFIVINTEWRIVSFSISESYVAVCEDWKHLESDENTTIYDSKGNFLFKLDRAPKSLYELSGYYSVVSFKSENILIAQSADYRYEIDLDTRSFIKETFTK